MSRKAGAPKAVAYARTTGRRAASVALSRVGWFWLLLSATFLLGIGAAAACGSSAGGDEGGSGGQSNATPLAPDIILSTSEGEFRLSDHTGDVTLLYFSFPG